MSGDTTRRPANDPEGPAAPTDPVLVRRAHLGRLAGRGRNLGFACFGLAVVVFLVAAVIGFNEWFTRGITVLLVVGSVVFIPAVIIGYGVQAADREDREQGRGV